MVNIDCCKLVGNFPIDINAIISINSRIGTEISKAGDNLIIGPTTGTVSITAYATDYVHNKCQGRANVSIPWIRKYDCDNDKIYFIFSGEGQSSLSGDVDGLAILRNQSASYPVVNASASSGPATLYDDNTQNDGYGLTYDGDPWPFSTDTAGGVNIDIGIEGYNQLYLQGFSLQCTPGQVATASYEFVYAVEN